MTLSHIAKRVQEKLQKIPNENLEEFESKIHALEYSLYPRAILLALGLKDLNKSVEESK